MRANNRTTPEIDAAPHQLDLSTMTSETRNRLSGPGLRTFLTITASWGMNDQEKQRALGMISPSTFYSWTSRARKGSDLSLPFDTLIRISAILGIHKALRIVFVRDSEALEWLRAPNAGPTFGGQTPLSLISSGLQENILLVRRHLDAWRGGTFSAPEPFTDAAEPLTGEDIVWL